MWCGVVWCGVEWVEAGRAYGACLPAWLLVNGLPRVFLSLSLSLSLCGTCRCGCVAVCVGVLYGCLSGFVNEWMDGGAAVWCVARADEVTYWSSCCLSVCLRNTRDLFMCVCVSMCV